MDCGVEGAAEAGAVLDWDGEADGLEAVACDGAGEPEPWKSFWKSMDLAGVPLPVDEAAAAAASDFPPAKPMVVFLD